MEVLDKSSIFIAQLCTDMAAGPRTGSWTLTLARSHCHRADAAIAVLEHKRPQTRTINQMHITAATFQSNNSGL